MYMQEDTTDYPTEHRDGGDRRQGARETGERRRLGHGVRLTFYGALSAVEDWLEDECRGEYQVVIVGMSDDLTSKTIEVMFELASDREKFKDNVKKF